MCANVFPHGNRSQAMRSDRATLGRRSDPKDRVKGRAARRLELEDAPPRGHTVEVRGHRAEPQNSGFCYGWSGLCLKRLGQERRGCHCIMAATDARELLAFQGADGCVMASNRAVMVLGRRTTAPQLTYE